MNIPECSSACYKHFHMTGGMHLTCCDLHKYDDVAGWLNLAKVYITTGSEMFDQEFVDMLNDKMKPFITGEII